MFDQEGFRRPKRIGDGGSLEFSKRQRVRVFNSRGNSNNCSSSTAGPANDVVGLDGEDNDPKFWWNSSTLGELTGVCESPLAWIVTESDESHITPAHASEDASSEKNKVISRILMNVMPPMIFEAIGHIKVFHRILYLFPQFFSQKQPCWNPFSTA